MNQTGRKVLASGSKKGLSSLLGANAEAFLPFLAKIKIPSVQSLERTGITSVSFIQVNVEGDGASTQVRYKREELAPLKLAMRSVAKCMKGKDKLSFLDHKQDPLPEVPKELKKEAAEGPPKEGAEGPPKEVGDFPKELKKEGAEGPPKEGAEGPPKEGAEGTEG